MKLPGRKVWCMGTADGDPSPVNTSLEGKEHATARLVWESQFEAFIRKREQAAWDAARENWTPKIGDSWLDYEGWSNSKECRRCLEK